MPEYLTFEEAIVALKAGKCVRNVDWGNEHYSHLKIIHSQEFADEKVSSQPFIACFFHNGLYMPHPYEFTDLDIIGGEGWELVDEATVPSTKQPGPDSTTVIQIAKTCHEVNRAYCQSIGDNSQPAWSDAPEWQRTSAINGVGYHLSNPDSKPEDSHNSWLEEKKRTGWKYGPVKDPEKKEHPCFVPYDELPPEQQVKDALFLGVVRSFE